MITSKNKIVQNYIYNVSYQIVVNILPVITVPYLVRVLGAANLGIARYVESVVTLFTVFGMLGLVWYANRAVAYSRHNNHDLSVCFWEIFILRIILLLITLLTYAICLSHWEYKAYFKIYAVYIIGIFLDVSWFFTGIEEMKPVVIRNYIGRLGFTALLFVCVHDRNSLVVYIWLSCLMPCVNTVMIFPWLKRYVSVVSVKEIHFLRHVIPALALFLPQAASQLYVQCDKVMIKNMISDIAFVSYYTENEKIAKMPVILATALTTVLMPRIAYEYSKGKKDNIKEYVQKALFCISFILIPCCFGLMAVSDTFVAVFLGKEFANTYGILAILCPTMIFIGISNVTGVQYLVAVDKKKELTMSYVIALIINMIINWLLIPHLNAYGAAIGTVLAEGAVAIVQYSFVKKDIGSIIKTEWIFKVLILSGLMGILVKIVGFLNLNNFTVLILQIMTGMAIYAVGVWKMHIIPDRLK